MTDNLVLIAGGGIGGLVTALTLEQIGVRCHVLEAVREMRPLGVGINLQPNAVRELYDLGISAADLDRVGVPAKEWALVGLNGNDIYAEPRGLLAGYKWPQYAVHRGRFHMLLHDTFIARAGSSALSLGKRVVGYERKASGGVIALIEDASGKRSEMHGALLIGADGIHSAVRAQMHPGQPPIHWGGAVMWRGTSWAKPIRTGSSFIGLGTHRHRMVIYPISHPDPATGLAMINWIAEVTLDNSEGWKETGWFRQVKIDDFIQHFADWTWDWLDGQQRGLEGDGLVPAGEDRRLHPTLRRLDVGLARRARPHPQCRHRLREPHDRSRSGPHVGARARRAAGRRRARHVSDGLERREPGDRRRPHARRRHARARRHAGRARRLRCSALRAHLAAHPAQPWCWAVRPAQHGGRALRRHLRQHRRCHPGSGARRLHGRLQGRGGLRHRETEQRGLDDSSPRARPPRLGAYWMPVIVPGPRGAE